MRFTLTYTGRLPSSSDKKVKHEIRLKLHPQLQELWRTHPALAVKQQWVDRNASESDAGVFLTEVADTDFATLVHPHHKLYAELDILVLRPEAPGAIVSHFGDIDNQLKTLFDALRRPTDSSEVPTSWSASADEQPLHCLLDDDKLITRVNVETDRLLKPGVDTKHVELTIRVTVKAFAATWGNLGLTG
ncbi:hypothetical protein ACIA5G_24000 [Amycolatopsis sp. NPDC051758]|uniref:hypothetical protein n=1 Tax=Amycolatopsis sp. NPDC051758 TaxID=3363935 RepID=UPI00379DB848